MKSYDNIGQLKVADSSVNTEDRGYSYDTAWNLSWRTNNGAATSYTVNSLNELTSGDGITYTYDGNGNPRTKYSSSLYFSFSFDDENRLTMVEDVLHSAFHTEFVYDGLGRLRQRLEYTNYMTGDSPGRRLTLAANWRLASETRYLYDRNRVIQERDGNNTPTVAYTRGTDLSGTLEGAGGIGGLLARSSSYLSGNWGLHNFYFADGNGNILDLVNGSQALAASYRYDPFGNLLSKSGSLADANVYRFSSKEFHANSGLYYYLYRFYDPNAQRWLTFDPLGETGGINLYGFVLNAPNSLIDAFGESIWGDPNDPNSKNNLDKQIRCKPKDCPPGTVPIDKYKPKLTHDQIEKIKKDLHLPPNAWVGIDPKGNVIINDGEGNCDNMGPWQSYGPFTKKGRGKGGL